MSDAASAAGLRPVDLRTERRAEALGIDERTPLFSWKLAGTGRGRRQSGYRVRVVADGATADPTDQTAEAMWDSGDVADSACVDVAYAGAALRPRTRYVWAVRVWDEHGRDSGWSEPTTFETGVFDEAEWSASWITSPDAVHRDEASSLDWSGPQRPLERIWLPQRAGAPDGVPAERQACFRTSFEIADPARYHDVGFRAAGAETIRAWLNGTPIAGDDGRDAALVDALRPNTNVLAIEAQTHGQPRGVVARLDLYSDTGAATTVALDGTARVVARHAAGAEEHSGWEQPDHDDAEWALAQSYGLHGIPPQGREPETFRPSPYLRREFDLAAPVQRARLYATALGIYEARLNGKLVGDHRLAPGWTDYHTRVPYQTYDVTDLLRSGTNVVSALLADGWYAGTVGWFGRHHYGVRPSLRARLDIEHTDGRRTVVTSDESWRVGEGAIRFADLQDGEVADARAEPTGWDQAGFDDTHWHPAKVASPRHGPLEAEVAPPIRVEAEIPAVSVTGTPSGAQVVDFGQNLVGWIRVAVRGTAGDRIVMRHAEVLDHRGELYTEALRGARATDEYILRGDPDGEIFEPRFTVHGFRYVAIHGLEGELARADIVARVAHAGMERIGEFSCSDERLVQLQRNIVWGQRGNFLTVPTDCPQRDERLGWTGDAQVFAATAAFNYDVRSFFRKWLRDLRDAQFSDGAVPHVAPDVLSPGFDTQAAGAAGWGDAIAIVPRELFAAYGDRRLLEENYHAITAWLGYLESHSDGLIRPAEGFADWLALMSTPRDLVQTAYVAYAAMVASTMATELGHAADVGRWDDLYQRVRVAFRAAFVRGGGELAASTQTAYLLALGFGLLEPDEEPLAAKRLVEEIASRNWHLSTGFLGTPLLLPVLTRFGYLDVAFRLLTQETYPSWLYPVVYGGATTVWERWDSWSDSRGFQDPGMTSFNHYAYGAVGEWMYRMIGGLAPDGPGYASMLIRPRPGGGLTWASTALETPYGRVATTWSARDGEVSLDVEIPPNTSAQVWLPTTEAGRTQEGGRQASTVKGVTVTEHEGQVVATIGSGTYTFTAPLD